MRCMYMYMIALSYKKNACHICYKSHSCALLMLISVGLVYAVEPVDTQGTVKNSPQFRGGLISQTHFHVLNRSTYKDCSSCP